MVQPGQQQGEKLSWSPRCWLDGCISWSDHMCVEREKPWLNKATSVPIGLVEERAILVYKRLVRLLNYKSTTDETFLHTDAI